MSSETKLTCYNLGCPIKQYKESENITNCCTFHPGQPFFHDAYKGWTCCNKKSVDFTEFLNIKGCKTGFHSNVKPPEPEKRTNNVNEEDLFETIIPRSPKIQAARPSIDNELVELKSVLSQSLQNQTYVIPSIENPHEDNNINLEVQIGKTCENNGCNIKYEGPLSNAEVCKYHPGVPVFHEGLKYWSCCTKRTTEFQSFLEQKGCTNGTHAWLKPKDTNKDSEGNKVVDCRNDWHQTGSEVIVTVYGKKFDPNTSFVKANGVKLQVQLHFPEEHGYYREQWILSGVISPEKSSVLMTPTKIEIKLKKAEPTTWPALEIPQEKFKVTENNGQESVGVDPLDLDDL